MKVYRKKFGAGPVVLGGNQTQNVGSFYLTFIKPEP
jgi:hypothetical protein